MALDSSNFALILNALQNKGAAQAAKAGAFSSGIRSAGQSIAAGIDRYNDRVAEQQRLSAEQFYADKVRREQEQARIAAEDRAQFRDVLRRNSEMADKQAQNADELSALSTLTAPVIDPREAMRQPTIPKGVPFVGGMPMAGVGAGLEPRMPTESDMARRIPNLPRTVDPSIVARAMSVARPEPKSLSAEDAMRMAASAMSLRRNRQEMENFETPEQKSAREAATRAAETADFTGREKMKHDLELERMGQKAQYDQQLETQRQEGRSKLQSAAQEAEVRARQAAASGKATEAEKFRMDALRERMRSEAQVFNNAGIKQATEEMNALIDGIEARSRSGASPQPSPAAPSAPDVPPGLTPEQETRFRALPPEEQRKVIEALSGGQGR